MDLNRYFKILLWSWPGFVLTLGTASVAHAAFKSKLCEAALQWGAKAQIAAFDVAKKSVNTVAESVYEATDKAGGVFSAALGKAPDAQMTLARAAEMGSELELRLNHKIQETKGNLKTVASAAQSGISSFKESLVERSQVQTEQLKRKVQARLQEADALIKTYKPEASVLVKELNAYLESQGSKPHFSDYLQ